MRTFAKAGTVRAHSTNAEHIRAVLVPERPIEPVWTRLGLHGHAEVVLAPDVRVAPERYRGSQITARQNLSSIRR